MLRDAALYRAVHHPVVGFTSQVQQDLVKIAKNREPVRVSGPTIGHWGFERKVSMLADARALLQRPNFLYADFGADILASGYEHISTTTSLSYYPQAPKLLTLLEGQLALVDLWEYIMDMSESVPVRNRCRALYLQIAVCIAHRLEFVEGFRLDKDIIHVSDHVAERYFALLTRCLDLCTSKLLHLRFLSDEHQLFLSHTFALIYLRFPTFSSHFITAAWNCTHQIRGSGGKDKQPQDTSSKTTEDSIEGPSDQITWHYVSLKDSESDQDVNVVTNVLNAFRNYKRNPVDIHPPSSSFDTKTSEGHDKMLARVSHRIDEALSKVFKHQMHANKDRDESFLSTMPLISTALTSERKVFAKNWMSRQHLSDAITSFTKRLAVPVREDLMVVTFTAALCNTVSVWYCQHAREEIVWYCIPGYFTFLRAYTEVLKRMCQRRQRMDLNTPSGTSNGSMSRLLSILDGRTADTWQAYWVGRETEIVYDASYEVLCNEQLVNVVLQVVLEGTNMLDPASVNYSFTVLQRLLQVAAAAASRRDLGTSVSSAGNALEERMNGIKNHNISESFDLDMFESAMRPALETEHVQTLLKVLTFLYNTLGLFPATMRRRLIANLILKEHFFQLFLHWNEEVQKIFCYILVFKVFVYNRLDLPCASDRILLAPTRFFEHNSPTATDASTSSATSASPVGGYWTQLSEMAHTLLLGASSDAQDKDEEQMEGRAVLGRLIEWDESATLKSVRMPSSNGSMHSSSSSSASIFHQGMDDEELTVDLLLASKLDAQMKMVAVQMATHGQKRVEGIHFPTHLEAYAERSLSRYLGVLAEYYESAFERPHGTPPAPQMEFSITLPTTSD